ncbi:MAG: FAD-dependent oxidoreductase [Lachnospiraceae bacterium]|nr:FAD-dependent oxidoreductase [Lachnospiraceae bacterium]
MSRLTFKTSDKQEAVREQLYKDLERRIVASPTGLCPVDLTASFVKLCLSQSCGKCTPCRVGLNKLAGLLDKVVDGEADLSTLDLIKKTAKVIYTSSDCTIGEEAGRLALNSIEGCYDDYYEHVVNKNCTCNSNQPVACVNLCPAHIDIPGYIALVKVGRYDDAVNLIRHMNPFPITCAYICEHPCESRCKRTIIDAPINIRGIKRVAIEKSKNPSLPPKAEKTGKKVAIIGGGPSGLSCAYYLTIMGHDVTVYEQRKKLGGMLRYGIPNYRLPRKKLDEEINFILSAGIKVECNVSIGKDIEFTDLKDKFDAVYISIGAHTDKKIGIEGEDAKNVMSAVEMLRAIGDEEPVDFKGKRVAIVGGGNVAMDVARSSIRLGAKSVDIIYRRRKADMTALMEEIEGAEAEGCNVVELTLPIKIEKGADGEVTGIRVKPQMTSEMSKGRPAPKDKSEPDYVIPCDIVVVAVGQGIESKHFVDKGVGVVRGNIAAFDTGEVGENKGVFAGGDCVTGPATVIKAIAGGRVAAANIDEYLGYYHEIVNDTDIPRVTFDDKKPCGRVELPIRLPQDRKNDFEAIEGTMSDEEACQECGRCLRCDHFGFGVFRGGRSTKW